LENCGLNQPTKTGRMPIKLPFSLGNWCSTMTMGAPYFQINHDKPINHIPKWSFRHPSWLQHLEPEGSGQCQHRGARCATSNCSAIGFSKSCGAKRRIFRLCPAFADGVPTVMRAIPWMSWSTTGYFPGVKPLSTAAPAPIRDRIVTRRSSGGSPMSPSD
jgi:hypothetical protein